MRQHFLKNRFKSVFNSSHKFSFLWQWFVPILTPNLPLLFIIFYMVFKAMWTYICDVLRDLVPFVQFKKREKHPQRNATFSKVKSNTPPWVFFMFFKLYKWYKIAHCITFWILALGRPESILYYLIKNEKHFWR